MNALISVIVPVYKVEQYLPRCLDSIVNQTYRNLEIILVDDGSPDNCGSICDDYARRDDRIRVIHQKNGGLSAARNAGLEIMQGEYVFFVDSDDWLSLDALQTLYERLVADGSDMALGRHTDAYPDGREIGTFCQWMTDRCYTPDEFISRETDQHYIPISAWGKLYRREIYAQLRFPKVKHAEDMMVLPTVLDHVRKISVSDKTLYYYYQRSNSMVHVMSEEACRDCLRANLLMTKYLLKKQSLRGIPMWFGRCIRQAYRMEDKTGGHQMMEEILGSERCRKLLNTQGWKNRLKWWALTCRPLATIIGNIRKTVRRR
jgi:glycosyltransferase involved in cell wall biosynthesis